MHLKLFKQRGSQTLAQPRFKSVKTPALVTVVVIFLREARYGDLVSVCCVSVSLLHCYSISLVDFYLIFCLFHEKISVVDL